jgi:uncharacterized protein (TIGR03118 family)
VAQLTDSNLKNPWGVALTSNGDFWVANAGSGVITLYNGDDSGIPIQKDSPVITVPHAAGQTQGSPTGMVFNPTSDFAVNGTPAAFLVSGLDGTISAVVPNPVTGRVPSQATLVVSTSGAVYTGLALAANSSGNFLFAANPRAGTVDVFDRTFKKSTLAGNFIDPNLPTNLVPFNVAVAEGELFVTYNDRANRFAGNVVDAFTTSGQFIGRFASGSNLVAPWAVVQAPSNFGPAAGDLLIGNFGDGHINVYNPTTGLFLGQILGPNGQPIAIERLWQLTFGNGNTAGTSGILYFAGGLNQERDGLFGSLAPMSPNQNFIAQAYTDLLHRPVDSNGMAFWNNLLNLGASRQQVIAGIESSFEYRAVEVNSLFNQFLHRPADAAGVNFWTTQMLLGASLEQVAAGIISSAEFVQRDAGGTIAGFLNALYADALGRAPDVFGFDSFTAGLQAGVTPQQVAAVVVTSTEFRVDDVRGFYQNFLRRQADPNGLRFYVNAMQRGATDEQVIAGIMASNEYFAGSQ